MPEAKTITEVLDGLVRQIVLLRDEFRCQKCGATAKRGRGGGLEVAHLLPKGQYPALRHELLNVALLCHRCHFFWWHKNPIDAWAWLTNRHGEAFIDWLRLTARTRSKVDKKALRLMLEMELQALERGKLPSGATGF